MTPAQEAAAKAAFCVEYAAYTGIPIEYLACSMEIDLYIGRRLLLSGTSYLLSAWTSFDRAEITSPTPAPSIAPPSFADLVGAKVATVSNVTVTTTSTPGVSVTAPPAAELAVMQLTVRSAVETEVERKVEVVLVKIENGEALTPKEAAFAKHIEVLFEGPGATGAPTVPTDQPTVAPSQAPRDAPSQVFSPAPVSRAPVGSTMSLCLLCIMLSSIVC